MNKVAAHEALKAIPAQKMIQSLHHFLTKYAESFPDRVLDFPWTNEEVAVFIKALADSKGIKPEEIDPKFQLTEDAIALLMASQLELLMEEMNEDTNSKRPSP